MAPLCSEIDRHFESVRKDILTHVIPHDRQRAWLNGIRPESFCGPVESCHSGIKGPKPGIARAPTPASRPTAAPTAPLPRIPKEVNAAPELRLS